jgi:hypothetical protein
MKSDYLICNFSEGHMKRFLLILTVLLSSGALYASDYDAFNGSFSMYDSTVENVILDKIQSQTDPETGKVKIGGLTLKFEFLDNALEEVDGLAVGAVHFTDGKDTYILDYHVAGFNVEKIVLVTKNKEYINMELYPGKKEGTPEEKKESK